MALRQHALLKQSVYKAGSRGNLGGNLLREIIIGGAASMQELATFLDST